MHEIELRISSILADKRFDDEACEDTRYEAIWELVVSAADWDIVLGRMIAILEDEGAEKHWATAAGVLWFGVERPMPKARVIALLYHRLMADLSPPLALDENLVWSITSNLKGVGYLSAYEPLNDPEVQHELERVRRRSRR